MEIAGGGFERPEELAVALDRAMDAEQPRAEELASLALDEARPHDDVHVAVLVFERDEDDAARRIGTLAAGDESGGARSRAMRQRLDGFRIGEAQTAQPLAQKRKRM